MIPVPGWLTWHPGLRGSVWKGGLLGLCGTSVRGLPGKCLAWREPRKGAPVLSVSPWKRPRTGECHQAWGFWRGRPEAMALSLES